MEKKKTVKWALNAGSSALYTDSPYVTLQNAMKNTVSTTRVENIFSLNIIFWKAFLY